MDIKLLSGKCLRCGHEWILRKLNPKICPRCNSAYWNQPRKEAKKEVVNIEIDRKVKGIFYKKEAYEAHLKKEKIDKEFDDL